MYIRNVILACILTTFPKVAVFGQLNPAEVAHFQQLKEQDKSAFVLTALQTRDAQLQNFAYKMSESSANVSLRTGETVQSWGTDFYTMKRKDNKIIMHGELFYSNDEPRGRFSTSWDGSVSRSLTIRTQRTNDYRGLIKDSESTNFKVRAYNYVLGVRMLTGKNMSLAGWLQDAIADGKPIEVEINNENDKQLITLTVYSDGDRLRYWKYYCDMSRGFMPIRAEYLYKNGETYSSESTSVTEAKEIDGLWVPMKVVRRTGTSADPEAATEYIYRISEFTRGTVTDKDFEITFPSGTDVVDEIAMVAYRVLPSGVHMLALVNPATGKSTIPEDTSIDDAIKDARKTAMSEKSARNNVPKEPPANQATQKPNVPASPHQVSASVTWFWIGIVILAIGTLSLIIGVKNFKAFRAIKKGS